MMLHRVASSLYGSLPDRKEPRVGLQYLYVSASARRPGVSERHQVYVDVASDRRTGILENDTLISGKRIHEGCFVVRVVEEAVVAEIVDQKEHN